MGYKIREARIATGMTQEELSEKSGVSRATISAMENGEAKCVMTSTLLKLASALNTTVDQIFFSE